MSEPTGKKLPENAFRPLQPGEKYVPMVPDGQVVTEVSVRTIVIGLVMTVIFSAAAGFIALKTGQGFETAIPIVIISVGLSALFSRKSTLLENVNIMAIGATASGAIGGTIFTLPALWILGVEARTSYIQIFLISLLGTWLGILLLIPFRRYFVSDMHGKLPFPEGTAIVETLAAGEQGGSQAMTLFKWGVFGFAFDSFLYVFRAWREVVSTSMVEVFSPLTDGVKWVCNMTASAAMAGLGFIIGLRYASIILAGSVLSWWVFVPVFHWLGDFIPVVFGKSGVVLQNGELLRDMDADTIFSTYVRHIGIGGIFVAGLMSIVKLWRVIYQALTTGMQGLFRSLKRSHGASEGSRTDRDLDMGKVMLMFLAVALGAFLYYRFSVLFEQPDATKISLVSLLIVLVVSFLFSAVSAWAIAMISVTPVSGMTTTSLIITGLVLVRLGLTGDSGMLAAILMGGIICTSLSMSGTMATEFKIAYWTGATPARVQIWSLIGAILAAVTTGLVIILLSETHGYAVTPDNPNPLPAPQANAMAAVVKGFFSSGDVPWFLYGMGAVIAVMAELLKVSSLAFALGMYLPIELNTPIFLGAILGYLVRKSSSDEKVTHARVERGNLIASGLIAGGGLAGIGSAFVIVAGWEKTLGSLIVNEGAFGNALGFFLFLGVLALMYWDCKRARLT